jgi:hypothetical protein
MKFAVRPRSSSLSLFRSSLSKFGVGIMGMMVNVFTVVPFYMVLDVGCWVLDVVCWVPG